MLVVQHICWKWSKLSRDAAGGALRSTLPRAHPFSGAQGVFVVDDHDGVDTRGYRSLLTTTCEAHVPGHFGVLRIVARAKGRFVLGITGNVPAGRPRLHPIEEAFELEAGGYARFMLNARITASSGQWYEEHTYNVTCGEQLPVDVFTARAPDRVFDLRAHLF